MALKKILAVAGLELHDRWRLFPAALTLGCVALALTPFATTREAASLVALGAATGMALVAAMVVGPSMLARDAASGRLSFLLSRPTSWRAIWAGKWLAAVVLVVGCGFLALAPWRIASPGEAVPQWIARELWEPLWLLVPLAVVLALGLANSGALALQARTARVASDLFLIPAMTWAVLHHAPSFGLFDSRDRGFVAGLLPVAAGLVLASAPQLALGRIDVARAYEAMSTTFWGVIASALLAAVGYAHWAVPPNPADLPVYVHSATHDPTSRLLCVDGVFRSRHVWPFDGGHKAQSLLVDSDTGGSVPLRFAGWRGPFEGPDLSLSCQDLVFSSDGRVAAGWRRGAHGSLGPLIRIDFGASPPRIESTELAHVPGDLWLSPAGTHALVLGAGRTSLFELPSGRERGRYLAPREQIVGSRFVSETAARLWLWGEDEGGRGGFRVSWAVDVATDADVRTRRLDVDPFAVPPDFWPPGHAPRAGAGIPVYPQRDLVLETGRQILLTTQSDRAAGAGGKGQLGCQAGDGSRRAMLLGFDANGREEWRLVLGHDLPRSQCPSDLPEWAPALVAEVDPGYVAVGFRATNPEPAVDPATGFWRREGWDVVVVDAADGRVVERTFGLEPVGARKWMGRQRHGWWLDAFWVERPERGDHGFERFFQDRDGRVWRVTFASGERKIVLGPGATVGRRLRVP